MAELYLILHKVRGEPAFDIAQPACASDGTAPCQPNCGCWVDGKCLMEGEWVIPTSGHTAHPIMHWYLNSLFIYELGIYPIDATKLIDPEAWPDWPDHYHCNNPTTKVKEAAGGLLSLLGLGPKQDFKKRRFTSGN